jgi:regulator of protease activity HflC (stomatin/prohibitin superfamily)
MALQVKTSAVCLWCLGLNFIQGSSMQILIILITLAFAAVVAYRLLPMVFKRITVYDYEIGLLYERGKLVRQVSAGTYWINASNRSLIKLDARRTNLVVAGQEVSTQDNIGLKVSVVVFYSIHDAAKAIQLVQSYYNELYAQTQLALREELSNCAADALSENLSDLDAKLLERLREPANAIGLELHNVQLRDLMFAQDIKRAFNEVLKARKEGEATLERARGESAALRNLANAAKLLGDNPQLLSLRLIQAIENSSGNSFALDSKLLSKLTDTEST